MNPNKVLVVAVLLSTAATAATAAGFPCERATSKIERMVCANSELSTLDEHLGRYYAAAKTQLGDGTRCLRDDQREWLRDIRDVCTDAPCLRQAYLNRLGELDALQPGATAVKQYDLPAVPALVWVIPAALDMIAAPPRTKATALQVRGRVLREFGEDGRGYVLRTDGGERFGLVQDMFLEPGTSIALDALVREDSRFLARGHLGGDDGQGRDFESDRCVFLYRLPTPAR